MRTATERPTARNLRCSGAHRGAVDVGVGPGQDECARPQHVQGPQLRPGYEPRSRSRGRPDTTFNSCTSEMDPGWRPPGGRSIFSGGVLAMAPLFHGRRHETRRLPGRIGSSGPKAPCRWRADRVCLVALVLVPVPKDSVIIIIDHQGPLSHPIPAVQPPRWERLNLPHRGPWPPTWVV
jgi:hypothetical protein